ncbi:MAG TPA: prepilin-type N-terminal cleavage/methylation domain-containing protein [Deferrisomatales bacterium]|nr:prepilin-type N-terminal cleavage/methylation domain-containing protein [Deferrisomatales bacterium]
MTRTRAQRGFTLIEVLIALVILTVGMAGMIPVMVQTIKGNAMGRDRTSAATWAQDKLEELRREDWGVSGPPATGLTAFLGTTTTETDAAKGLTRGWRILDTCTACTAGRVWAIEVCAAETATAAEYNYTDVCFSATPLPAFHFFSLRSNL